MASLEHRQTLLKESLDSMGQIQKQLKHKVIMSMNSVCYFNVTLKNTNKVLVPLGDYYVKRSVHQAQEMANRMLQTTEKDIEKQKEKEKEKERVKEEVKENDG